MFCPFLPPDENNKPRECSVNCALATKYYGEEAPNGFGCSFNIIADKLKDVSSTGLKVFTKKTR